MPQAVARGALGAGDRPRCGAASCRPGLRTGLRRHCRRPPAPPRAARRARGPRRRGLAPDGTSEVHRLGVDRRRDDRWHGTRRPHRPGPRAGPWRPRLAGGRPEQRWAREAAFHLVQAQTAAARAQLTAFARW